jgi:hypothetical protein
MKTNKLKAPWALIITICAVAPTIGLSQTSPSIPVGSLTASPTVVQTGTKPTLTWNINYPSVATNVVTIPSPTSGTVSPARNLLCDIRILGLGVTSYWNGKTTYYRTRGMMKYNGSSSWTTVYDGKQTDSIVQKQGIVMTGVSINNAMDMSFGGQYYNNGWYTFFSSGGPSKNIRTLVNGGTPPSCIPAYNAPSLETFLKPYLDASGKVKIGPMDVIVFMELTDTNPNSPGYDLQDLVMLLTFRTP